MTLRIGIVQTCTGIDPDANARALAADVRRLAEDGARMVFTPEMSGVLDRSSRRLKAHGLTEETDPTLAALRIVARDTGIAISLGSLAVLRDDGRLANRGLVIGPDGQIAARYDKMHMFDVTLGEGETYRESSTYVAGDRPAIAALPWGKLGLTICYDVRFPALFAALATAGADVIAVPAAFTRPTGAAHWEILLRARAIETGAFIVAAGQTGRHEDGRDTWGHSLVISPWGKVLVDMGEDTGIRTVDIDLAEVAQARGRIPSLAHIRAIPPVAGAAA